MGPKWSVGHFGCILASNLGPQPPGSPFPPTRVATHGKQVAPFSRLIRHARGCQGPILVTPGPHGGPKWKHQSFLQGIFCFRLASIKKRLCSAYSVLLARIMCSMPAFHQYGKIFPKHIPHEFSNKMSEATTVLPPEIMFKNEVKHEDCLSIMDSYEDQQWCF